MNPAQLASTFGAGKRESANPLDRRNRVLSALRSRLSPAPASDSYHAAKPVVPYPHEISTSASPSPGCHSHKPSAQPLREGPTCKAGRPLLGRCRRLPVATSASSTWKPRCAQPLQRLQAFMFDAPSPCHKPSRPAASKSFLRQQPRHGPGARLHRNPQHLRDTACSLRHRRHRRHNLPACLY